LLQALWPDDDGDIAALHTLVYELRALVDRPFPQPMVESVRGIGYRLAESP
jgi:DNA-binding response OmpR family regulator